MLESLKVSVGIKLALRPGFKQAKIYSNLNSGRQLDAVLTYLNLETLQLAQVL